MKTNLQNSKHKIPNTQSGITLVALIITVIVLLILAMVSISLIMNGGIISRAERGKDIYSEEEIGEQLKLVYAEYQMGQYDGTPGDVVTFITTSLQEKYGTDKVANNAVTVSNGKITATINGRTYQYNSKTGVAGEYKNPFNYGEKDIDTLVPGDDITLGTEKFKVFSVTETEIKAMPYYNLLLSSNPIKQGTDETKYATGTSDFASECYWTAEKDVEMGDPKNKIQHYVNDYKTTLENMGAENITVRIPKTSDFSYTNGEEQIDVAALLKNPSGQGTYWVGTCTWNTNRIRIVYPEGTGYSEEFNNNSSTGIRPIIIISK